MKYTKYIVVGVAVLVFGLMLFNRGPANSSDVLVSHDVIPGTVIQAPDFTLQSLDGSPITLSSYKGQKAVILDFWATWCPNCRRDMPRMNEFYKTYQDKIEVIGINLHENKSVVSSFVSSKGLIFPIVLDPFSQAANAYGVRYTNFHVLINKDGNVIKIVPGDISESDFQLLI